MEKILERKSILLVSKKFPLIIEQSLYIAVWFYYGVMRNNIMIIM